MAESTFFDGQRLRKAHSVRRVPPISHPLATSLAQFPELRCIKIFASGTQPQTF
jgi:hypothetical protein